MDILKSATDWTRAEVLSSAFFILAGLAFLAASLGFWHLGRTEVARAYIVPATIAGGLLLIIGGGIFIQSYGRLSGFPAAHAADAAGFLAAELDRADRVLGQYRIAVFRVIPLIVAVSALLIPVMASPVWRASLITTIVMMAVIMVIDTSANARLEVYREQLALAKDQG